MALEADLRCAAWALRTGAYDPSVREDCLGGLRYDVNGALTFYTNGVRHDGPWDLHSSPAALQAVSYDPSQP